MKSTLRVRRGTAATWTAANPVLAYAEPGLETDTNKLKFGDGVTAWNALPYFASGGAPGPAGPPGKDGSTIPLIDGKRGAWGLPGPVGDKGSQGIQGIQGIQGNPGAVGNSGRDAPPGLDGKSGAWGLPGPAGRDGANGTAGASGRDGIPGRDGLVGRWGLPGPPGDRGIQGTQGNAGNAGVQGISGPPGFDGRQGASGLIPVIQLVSARDCGSGNTADVVANAVDTYLTGSMVEVTRALKAGSIFRWQFRMTKTGAGVAAPIWTVRGGPNGSTADTALVALTGSAQTGVIDDGWCEIVAVVRTMSTTGVVSASLCFTHTLTTTGLSTTQTKTAAGNSAAFDLTSKPLRIGVSCNPGSLGVWTFQLVNVGTFNLQPAY